MIEFENEDSLAVNIDENDDNFDIDDQENYDLPKKKEKEDFAAIQSDIIALLSEIKSLIDQKKRTKYVFYKTLSNLPSTAVGTKQEMFHDTSTISTSGTRKENYNSWRLVGSQSY